jgi:hypothetical protein
MSWWKASCQARERGRRCKDPASREDQRVVAVEMNRWGRATGGSTMINTHLLGMGISMARLMSSCGSCRSSESLCTCLSVGMVSLSKGPSQRHTAPGAHPPMALLLCQQARCDLTHIFVLCSDVYDMGDVGGVENQTYIVVVSTCHRSS